MPGEFEEIGHSGGKIEFKIAIDEQGHRKFSVRVYGATRGPFRMFAHYAMPPGIPVETIRLAGLGVNWTRHRSMTPFLCSSLPTAKDCTDISVATVEATGGLRRYLRVAPTAGQQEEPTPS